MDDRVVLVTGASSGIGRAIALAMAARGASVCLSGRDQNRLDAVAHAAGKQAVTAAVDLATAEAPEQLADVISRRFDRLDILIHCAGIIRLAHTESAAANDLTDQVNANVLAPYRLTQRLLPALLHTQGDIVFVNSSIVHNPRADAAQYSATKHALRGIADCLRAELNPSGIRVLSLYVGKCATPLQERLFQEAGTAYSPEKLLQPESVAQAVVAAVTLPRDAEVTDLHIRPTVKG